MINDRNVKLDFGAGAVARPKIHIGRALENYWTFEAFAPVKFGDLAKAAGQRMTANIALIATSIARLRNGQPVLPLGHLRQALAHLLPDTVFLDLEQPIWRIEMLPNLVVTAGLNDSLTQHLKGSSYTAAWYCGLTASAPTFAAGDTMSSHAGWTEFAAYDEANRQTITFGTVSGGSVDNSASKAAFTISTNGSTIGGGFMTTNNTKSGTTGTLYGGAAFTAGDKGLDDGDTLNVTVTCTATAS